MIAARRIGGSPPSHSHWSITHGQIRSVTAPASAGEASLTCGKRSARPARIRTFRGRIRQPRADVLGADHRDRDDRRAGLEREPADAALGLAERAGPGPRALGEDQDDVAAGEDRLRGLDHVLSPAPRSTGNAPSALRIQAATGRLKISFLAT